MEKTIKQGLLEAVAKFKENNIPTPRLDAELLLAYTLKRSREYLLAHPEQKIDPALVTSYKLLVTRRSHHEPLAYITGQKEFFGLDLIVNKNTLIPRPETELLVEQALSIVKNENRKNFIVVDVGTGSGCIAISLAKQLKNLQNRNASIQFLASDVSKQALSVARKNAKRHGVGKKIEFAQGDLLEPLAKKLDSKADNRPLMVLANLPYLSRSEYSATGDCVKNFEPKTALFSSEQGLSHYKKLFEQIVKLFPNPQSIIVLCEFSPQQKNSLEKLAKEIFPDSKAEFKKDLAGKWRLLVLRTC